ncbi:MAG TPA: Fe-S cluster assembly ATPase SufC [Patescibacteria group bacterium]|nr:Fe-S cluster assembly ATPase SufC [Patescibacteria group bacterium]
MLILKNLTVSVEKKKILSDISYTFEKGKIYAIMGPNGSGKSTLAQTVMGHPSYSVSNEGRIIFNQKDITDLTPDKRAHEGLFLTFQSPFSLSGVTIYQLIRYMKDKKSDILDIRKKLKKSAQELQIPEELLGRSLNENFSGGEKKKMEVLQSTITNPSCIFFDEIDTGVDIDALKTIALFIKKQMTAKKTFIIITHYNRILKYLRPDTVIVLNKGKITQVGNGILAQKIETQGYRN